MDTYFYKSLFVTMMVYIILTGSLVGLVLNFGMAGFFLIMGIIIALLVYFYS